MEFSAREFAFLTGSTCIGEARISNALYDSRKVVKGSMFVCIRGAKCDGHDFIAKAIENGASAVLAERKEAEKVLAIAKDKCAVILSDNPLKALGRFASLKAAASKATIIGITGSCGKTTTKEMLSSILKQSNHVVSTPGNLNSEYGLPLSLLMLEENSDFGVFEIGVDHIGEMAGQASLLSPEVAAITNIGISHLAEFGTRERIAIEKGGIFLPQTKAFTIAGGDFNSYFRSIKADLVEARMPFRNIIDMGLDGYRMNLGKHNFLMNAIGDHNLIDASLAVSIARYLGVDDADIAAGLSSLVPVFGRSRVVKEGSVTVIEDCYNAAYDSVYDAIKTISRLSWKGSKHIVLGDMRELGSESQNAHRRIGEALATADCDNIFLYGNEIEESYETLRSYGLSKKIVYTDDFDVLASKVRKETLPGDLMLLKGSRVMAMERLFDTLRQVG